jgi:glutaredoxin
MQELTLFYLETCPFCQRVRGYMRELCDENPDYAKIPVKLVEERQESELADRYDYYYVPCFYLGREKIAEGAIEKEGVRRLFNLCLAG